MKHDFFKFGYDKTALKYEHIESTAVLTPEQNNPKALLKGNCMAVRTKKFKLPVLDKSFIEQRRKWCVYQEFVLSNNPSNAVLKGDF